MTLVNVQLSESQIVRAVRKLSPEGKQAILRTLISGMDEGERLVEYGEARIHTLAAARGLHWDAMTNEERERLVDELLHEEPRA